MGYFRQNIEKLAGYTPGYQPQSPAVVKLNTNENPYPPSPKVIKAIKKITAEQLRKYPPPLADSFRIAAAEVLGIEPENIICTNGGDDLLTICFRAFGGENRPVAYPVPTYTLYPVLSNIQNCPAVIEIPFDKDFNLPEGLADTNAALTIICNPNAPTGTLIKKDDIASLAEKLKGILLIDEAYVDFAEDNCLSLIKDFENVIILRSMSKGYSLAGIRFGFGIAPAKLINGLLKVKDSYNVDTLAIAAATAAIKDQKYFRKNVEKIKAQRRRLTSQLQSLGFQIPPSSANFLLAQSTKVRAIEIYEKLAKRDIYVRYWPQPAVKNKIRITVGSPKQNDILIDALKQIIAE